MECLPILKEHPLSSTGHFVAGCDMLATTVAEGACGFEAFYAALGVAAIATVCDGDCGLDVMCMMLGQKESLASRQALRIEISDYLLERIGETWMHEHMWMPRMSKGGGWSFTVGHRTRKILGWGR